MSKDKKIYASSKGTRVWLPEGSEAENILFEIEQMQEQKFGKALPRHRYLIKPLEMYYSELDKMPTMV
tara:strand:+ start:360 stop:563 length:204 start_codon:yes stop_codon:yes gene_type:complete